MVTKECCRSLPNPTDLVTASGTLTDASKRFELDVNGQVFVSRKRIAIGTSKRTIRAESGC